MQVLLQIFAGIAQLVEQRIRNAQVAGSSPAASSRVLPKFRRDFCFFVPDFSLLQGKRGQNRMSVPCSRYFAASAAATVSNAGDASSFPAKVRHSLSTRARPPPSAV